MIPEIVVIPFDRKPVHEVESVSGYHAARVRRLVGGPPEVVCFWKNPEP